MLRSEAYAILFRYIKFILLKIRAYPAIYDQINHLLFEHQQQVGNGQTFKYLLVCKFVRSVFTKLIFIILLYTIKVKRL